MTLKPSRIIFIIISVLVIMSVIVFLKPGFFLSLGERRVSWIRFAERRGTVFGEPFYTDSWHVPIKLQVFTSAPLVYNKSVVKVEKYKILFYLTEKWDENSKSVQEFKTLDLGKIPYGRYKLFYIDKNEKCYFLQDIALKK